MAEGNGEVQIFRAPGMRVSPVDLEVQTGPYPLQYAPLALVALDGGKAGYIPQKIRTARAATGTGPLAAGAYAAELQLDLIGAAGVRIHRVAGYVVDALDGAARSDTAKLAVDSMVLNYQGSTIGGDGDNFRVTGFGGAGVQNQYVDVATAYPAGAARLPIADPDQLAAVAAGGGEGKLVYESPEGLLCLPFDHGLPPPAVPVFASLVLRWTRTAALNDEDLAMMIVTYTILAQGMYPER